MITVDFYEGKTAGKALSLTRPQLLEEEILQHELVAKRDLSVRLGMTVLSSEIDWQLKRLHYQRELSFPLFTKEEESVWADFLPTRYSTNVAKSNQWLWKISMGTQRRIVLSMEYYRFDLPPLSVLEFWQSLREKQEITLDEFGIEHKKPVFDTYEIWTPEVFRPEPILVGYLDSVGPFLLAQWGESLRELEDIKHEVEARRRVS